MSLDLYELKKNHDKAYNSGQVTRERGADDLIFYFVTQWSGDALNDSQLAYKGEFNIIKKAGRQIISDLAANPIQNDFEPVNETRKDSAELADGLYRSDDNNNTSIEAYENAKQEAVVCGVGAWLLYTDYVSSRTGNKNQVIKRTPIQEANNNVFWDPNAKLMDKSDADYVSVLRAYSEDGYKDLVYEMTGEELETVSLDSFKQPEHSYTFPWVGGEGKKIYVVEFYHRTMEEEKVLTMVDPFGETQELLESDLENIMDDMLDRGFSIESEKVVERYQVRKYIASGSEILNGDMVDEERTGELIVGEEIPVVPEYGEYAWVEGELHYEGVTRLAKDPQRLRNFQLSYLADIVSQSPRNKPIFWPEQIAGFENMYQMSGVDNNYPYLLMNRYDGIGAELPLTPVGMMPEQTMPVALVQSIALSRQAVEDVANPGIPQDIADPDLSGKAVLALQNRLDMQSMVYQEHFKHAKRRDAQIWASMAAVIYDVPRKSTITLPDGSRQEVEIMQTVLDDETGELVTLNDLRGAEFDVYSKIGPSYSSQKEQTLDRLETSLVGMAPDDPMRKAVQLKILTLSDGVEMDDLREYANKQLVLSGIKQPETDEEKEMLAQAQAQPPQPDAAMVLAKAEELKGQADIMQEKREGIKMQLDNENEKANTQIDLFRAQTDRMKVQVEAQKAGATINKTNVDSVGSQLDNAAKIVELQQPKSEADMNDDELFQQIMAG